MGTARDAVCATCGQDISPNDVSVIQRGILWVDGKPHHHLCFENDPRTLKARIEELETRIVGLEAMLCDAQGEVGRLKAALRPFADAYRWLGNVSAFMRKQYLASWCSGPMKREDFERAAEAIKE